MIFHNIPSRVTVFGLLVLIIFASGCSSTPDPADYLENLEKVLRVYNNAFESRSENGGSMYIKESKRPEYLIDYARIRENVSFNESQAIKYTYLLDGEPVKVDLEDPEQPFNEALILMRYTLVISPSNRLKTIVVEQRWKREGDRWYLDPALSPFLN